MAGQKSDDGSSSVKKTRTRAKRSRLGRGLSALVDAPVAVDIEHSSRSDNSTVVAGDLGGDVRGSGGRDDGGGDGGVAGAEARSSGSAVDADERAALVGDHSLQTPVSADVTVIERSVSESDLRVVGERIVEIGVGVIGVNRDQPRRVFDEDSIAELAASIGAHGVMQPIVVRRALGEVQDGVEFELIAGERRWRASRVAGLETVPAIVRDVDDVTSAQLALIENVQREDRYGMTQEKISKAVGVSRSSVANIVRLLELPAEVQTLVSSGALSAGHGKVLLSLGSPEKQRKFAARAIKEGWNVRTLERAVGDELGSRSDHGAEVVGKNTEDQRALSVLRDLEVRVGEQLGTRVKIKTDKSRQRGRVVIEFYDLDQFDGLLGRLGVSMDG
jgi:ParB family chromosome partitioning protein